MTLRIVHPSQQGARLSWSDSLFELVEQVPPPAIEEVAQAPLPQPEVSELQWPQLIGLFAVTRGEVRPE